MIRAPKPTISELVDDALAAFWAVGVVAKRAIRSLNRELVAPVKV